MNLAQRLIVKALNASGVMASVVYSLFRFVGTDMPIWMKYEVGEYISKGYERNAAVFAVVNKIATTAAAVPIRLYKVGKDGSKEEIADKNHPILKTLKQPNSRQSGAEFMQEAISFLLVTGNAYLNGSGATSGEDAGKFREFHIAPSQYTQIISGGWKMPVKEYVVNFDMEHKIPAEEIIHIRTTNLDYTNGQQLYGMSYISAGAMAITSSNSGYEAKVKDHQNNGIRGFLSADNKEGINLDPDKMRKISDHFKEAGKNREFGVTNMPVKFNPVGMSVVDMAILDSIDADLRTICNIFFGVSSNLFNDKAQSSYNNIKEMRKAFYTDAIMPVLSMFMDKLNSKWISQYGDDLLLEPDYSDIEELQEDLKEKAAALKDGPVKVDEWRQAMGFDKVGGALGETILMPANYMPVETYLGSEDWNEEELSEDELAELGMKEYGGKMKKVS